MVLKKVKAERLKLKGERLKLKANCGPLSISVSGRDSVGLCARPSTGLRMTPPKKVKAEKQELKAKSLKLKAKPLIFAGNEAIADFANGIGRVRDCFVPCNDNSENIPFSKGLYAHPSTGLRMTPFLDFTPHKPHH